MGPFKMRSLIEQDLRLCVSVRLPDGAHAAGHGLFCFQDSKFRKVVLEKHMGDVRKIQ